MWERLDSATNTMATEIPGLGCIVGSPGVGLVFVPGARLRMLNEPIDGATHLITRDERAAPPIAPGLTREEILKNAIPDPGARAYFVIEEDDD